MFHYKMYNEQNHRHIVLRDPLKWEVVREYKHRSVHLARVYLEALQAPSSRTWDRVPEVPDLRQSTGSLAVTEIGWGL